jgi:hypothetical protein
MAVDFDISFALTMVVAFVATGTGGPGIRLTSTALS